MSKKNKSFFCKNCMSELKLEEMGIYLRGYDDSITHFCPNCGWLEMIPAKDMEWTEEDNKILEDGPEEYYEYPDEDRIVKYPSGEWVQIHHKNLQQMRREQ